jgi:hypothetical protein
VAEVGRQRQHPLVRCPRPARATSTSRRTAKLWRRSWMRGVPWLPRSTQPSCRRRCRRCGGPADHRRVPQPAARGWRRRTATQACCAQWRRALRLGSAPGPRRRSGAAAPAATCRTCSAADRQHADASGRHRHRATQALRRCADPCRRSTRTRSRMTVLRSGGPSRPAVEQGLDLLVAEDVRGHPARDRPEGRLVGHLGSRLELLQPARKRPEQT